MCSRERKREKLQSQSCLQREGIKTRILFKTNRKREREKACTPRERNVFPLSTRFPLFPSGIVCLLDLFRRSNVVKIPLLQPRAKFITHVNACVSTSITKSCDDGIFMIPFMIVTLRRASNIYTPSNKTF